MVESAASNQDKILHTPWGITVARVFQVIFALLVFGIAAVIIHGVYIEELGLCIAEALFTFIITAYLIITEKVNKCRPYYHIIAVVSLECFQWIMWIATFAATAARRAGFVIPVNPTNCQNDGSLINSSWCNIKRQLETRTAILFKNGQILMSAAAGIGAIIWLLYTGTFIWTCKRLAEERKKGRFRSSPKENTDEPHQLEGKEIATQQAAQGAPLLPPQPSTDHQVHHEQYAGPQYQQYPPQQYATPDHSSYNQAYSPQQQQPQHTAYTPSPVNPQTSPSPPSELTSHEAPLGYYTAQLPIYDDHYYQTEYIQHHSAELPSPGDQAPPVQHASQPQPAHSEKQTAP
ncbi:hypothetical protein VHEMI06103 [[Torrubiella] hemipterigena]|uniref:MARVEL domain-containing protein n=1 Tax=[Torrubiella] hemipterigena TaxID=1531966 RepID=A0A0A1TKC2_9HYPO|nr:hypothetical protein VHEMI06103 [[Torrubiella] hemipterigena]